MAEAAQLESGIIAEVVRQVVRVADPLKVILFGSRARGDARPDSDFDLLVVRESNQRRDERSAPIYTALASVPAEVEVMVYTPAEIEIALKQPVTQAILGLARLRKLPVFEGQFSWTVTSANSMQLAWVNGADKVTLDFSTEVDSYWLTIEATDSNGTRKFGSVEELANA